jgi:hypothetical protein
MYYRSGINTPIFGVEIGKRIEIPKIGVYIPRHKIIKIIGHTRSTKNLNVFYKNIRAKKLLGPSG